MILTAAWTDECSPKVDQSASHAPAGIRAELILAAMDRRAGTLAGPSNHGYLRERVRYDGDRLLDEGGRGVMMAWEGEAVALLARVIAIGTDPPDMQQRGSS